MSAVWWVVESSVRLTVLVGLAAVAVWVLRVHAADIRLRVWTGVIAASLLLPWLPTQWLLPISLGLTPSTSSSIVLTRSSVAFDTAAPPAGGVLSSLDLVTMMVLAYAIGVMALLARLVAGWSWARRLTTGATPVDGRAFFESPMVHVPVTVGLLHPKVILPETWRTWPDDMLAAVLAHESAHASRRDGLWLTLALLHRALQWINPLSWWLPRHMGSLSERASDDAALARGVAPTRYAEILLGFATAVATRHRRVAWMVAMARQSGRDTERRLDRVLTWKGRAEMNRSRLVVLALVLVSGSAAVYTAGLSPAATPVPPLAPPAPAVAVALARESLPEVRATAPSPTPTPRVAAQAETKQKPEPVIVQPVVTKRVDPRYTPEAMRAKIQGIVTLLVTIDAKGVVTSATVAESVDAELGLDAAAIDAVMQWSFLPGTIDRVPRTFSVKVSMEFRLH